MNRPPPPPTGCDPFRDDPPPNPLRDAFGGIDIYLFDILLRGLLLPPARVLDAGCGAGRNLHHLRQAGFRLTAVDRDADAVAEVRSRLGAPVGEHPGVAVLQAPVEALPFRTGAFDAVLSSAVLHFATSPDHFRAMLDEMWRVLAPGGLFWARLASDVGIEDRVVPLGHGCYTLPDGTDRFLVDQEMLLEEGARLDAVQVDPIKTTNVQGMRCMTTWLLRKPGA